MVQKNRYQSNRVARLSAQLPLPNDGLSRLSLAATRRLCGAERGGAIAFSRTSSSTISNGSAPQSLRVAANDKRWPPSLGSSHVDPRTD